MRSVLHYRNGQAISGEIILRDKDKYALRVRVGGRQVNSSEFESENPDDLMDKAAPDVMEKIKPSVTAMALYREHPEQGLLEADDIIARFDESDVNVQWAYVLKGNHSLERHNYADAERMFRKAVSLNWSNPQPHIQLGLALQRQGKFDDAIKQFRRVLSINPKLALAYNNIGVALAARAKPGDKLDNAIAQYHHAIDVDPRYPLPHNNLGLALSHQGDVDNAIEEFNKAIQVDPKYLYAHWNLAYALEHQVKLEDAIAEYRSAIECANDRKQLAILHTSVGDVLRRKAGADGNMDGAIAEYRHAIGIDPDNIWAHNNLGSIWRDQGRIDDAIAEFRNATKIYPEMEDMRENLVRALHEKEAAAATENTALKD
jgi:tetratricopeptide (TPR) repeat protein